VTGQRVGYVRVSTLDQNTIRQLEGVDVDRVFEDKASGRDLNRPDLEEMIKFVRDGDTVLVHSMDCLARNLEDLRSIVRRLTAKKVRVEFVKEQLSITGDDNAMANLLLNVIGPAELVAALFYQQTFHGRRASTALTRDRCSI
jgi:DNA invertase Pin-like site-specific DNA recombinase